MKTILFHSHRGGTGRSLCLSNCAAYLAMQGKKVLAMDMDLDAGGLSIIFKGIPTKRETTPKGLVRILTEELSENIADEIVSFPSTKIGKDYPLEGQLDFIFIDPDPFWADQIQKKFTATKKYVDRIINIKQTILAECDYTHLLVDLPSGLNPIREAFLSISDAIIVLSRPNKQGAYGTRILLDDMHERGLKTFFILSNVPSPRSKNSTDQINKFLSNAGIPKGELTAITPYDSQLAFSEELTVLTRPLSDISKVYIEISKYIER